MSSNHVTLKFGADISAIRSATREIRSNTQALSTTMQSVAAKIAILWQGVVPVLQQVAAAAKKPFAEFSRWEDASTRLAPLVGGLDRAKEICRELRNDAANGTMSFEQLAGVAGRLATVFKSTENVKKWTKVFHDLSAGTGLDINELVGNFVKSKASERFEAGLMDMFAQKGVNIFPELVKQTGVAETALRKMAAAGTLSFAEIEKALLALSTGTGKYAGQASALSGTLSGNIGTLAANINTLAANAAQPLAELIKPIAGGMAKLAGNMANSTGIAKWASEVIALTIAAKGLQLVLKKTGINAFFLSVSGAIKNMIANWKRMEALYKTESFSRRLYANSAAARTFSGILGSAFPRAAAAARAAKTAISAILPFGIGIALQLIIEKIISLSDATDEARRSETELKKELRDIADVYEDATENESLRNTHKTQKRNLRDLQEEINALEAGTEERLKKEREYAEKSEAVKKAHARALLRIEQEELEKSRKQQEDAQRTLIEQRNAIFQKIQDYETEAAFSKKNTHEQRASILREAETITGIAKISPEKISEILLGNAQDSGSVPYVHKEGLERLLEIRKQLNAINTQESAGKKTLENRIALLKAELKSTEALAAEKEKQRKAEIAADFERAGYSRTAARAAAEKFIALETAVTQQRQPGNNSEPTRIRTGSATGIGTIGTAQATFGGGRSINIGMSAAIAVAREQLSVLKQIYNATKTEKNVAVGLA